MKSPAFQFYPADFLADENVALMTNQEIGGLFKGILQAGLRNDVGYLRRFAFIGGVFKGGQKRESLRSSVRKDVLSAGECAYCGRRDLLTVDHIFPYSKGGTHDRGNLQCLCFPCNLAKSDSVQVDAL